MVKRVLFGIVWFVILYFLACALAGGIAGGLAGGRDPEHAAEAGAKAGAAIVQAIRGYLFLGAVAVSVLGSWMGLLPGTRIKRSEEKAD